MIEREQGIDRQEYIHRENLKDFYRSPTGIEVLSQEILQCGVLSEIVDSEGVTAHNLCIRKLEQIGLLDEEGLVPLIRYLLDRDPTKRPVETQGA